MRKETGSAMAEMAVLLPLYLLLLYGMYFMGEISLAQLISEKAARCAAWDTSWNARKEAKRHFESYSFFENSPPSILAYKQSRDLFTAKYLREILKEAKVTLNQYGGAKNQELLQHILNNPADKAMFRRSEALVQFRFTPAGLDRLGTVTIRAYHVVDLPSFEKRSPKPSQKNLRHAIEEISQFLGN